MKIDVLLFTQTMHSLLSSYLSLQNALKVCSEIFTEKKEKKFVQSIMKKINEGKKFSLALLDYKNDFSSLYISLVSIGEESGTLGQIFGHLCSYLKAKKSMNKKIIQALMYPVLVLITAISVVIILIMFVMPRMEEIFEAFSASSDIAVQMERIKIHFFVTTIIISVIILIGVICLILHKINDKVAFFIDNALLRIPILKNYIVTKQMNDFSFAMKLLSSTHYPLVQSLIQAGTVLTNKKINKAVMSICRNIIDGMGAGEAFEKERVFPKYFTVWVKIAEENGNVAEAFREISDYYQNENENILMGIMQSIEPVFILITGAVIIGVIGQFVIPIFNLLGAL